MARVFVAHECALGRRVCEGESELLTRWCTGPATALDTRRVRPPSCDVHTRVVSRLTPEPPMRPQPQQSPPSLTPRSMRRLIDLSRTLLAFLASALAKADTAREILQMVAYAPSRAFCPDF
jgi:hypothetical protein